MVIARWGDAGHAPDAEAFPLHLHALGASERHLIIDFEVYSRQLVSVHECCKESRGCESYLRDPWSGLILGLDYMVWSPIGVFQDGVREM